MEFFNPQNPKGRVRNPRIAELRNAEPERIMRMMRGMVERATYRTAPIAEIKEFAEHKNRLPEQVCRTELPGLSPESRVLPMTMNQARIAQETDFLSTYGAGPCLILAVYDPVSKVSGLAHVDVMTDAGSICEFIHLFEKDRLEISIVSGEINVFGKVYSILKDDGLLDNIKRLCVDFELKRVDNVVLHKGEVYWVGKGKMVRVKDEVEIEYFTPRNDPVFGNMDPITSTFAMMLIVSENFGVQELMISIDRSVADKLVPHSSGA